MLWAKNRNSIFFKSVIKQISNLPERVFLCILRNIKKCRKSKIKIFQIVWFGVKCPKYRYRGMCLFSSSRGQPQWFLFTIQQLCFSRQNEIFSINSLQIHIVQSFFFYELKYIFNDTDFFINFNVIFNIFLNTNSPSRNLYKFSICIIIMKLIGM